MKVSRIRLDCGRLGCWKELWPKMSDLEDASLASDSSPYNRKHGRFADIPKPNTGERSGMIGITGNRGFQMVCTTSYIVTDWGTPVSHPRASGRELIHKRPVSHVEVALCFSQPLITKAFPRPTPYVVFCWKLIIPNINRNYNSIILHRRNADHLHMYNGRTDLSARKRQSCARGSQESS